MAVVALDFDGTLTTHEYPLIGLDVGAVPVLKELMAKGHKLILYTMRCQEELQDAVEWCEKRGIELWGVNNNPEQDTWTTSPKVYANIYIDDAALGTPLTLLVRDSGIAGTWFSIYKGRPFVNWVEIRRLLVERGIL